MRTRLLREVQTRKYILVKVGALMLCQRSRRLRAGARVVEVQRKEVPITLKVGEKLGPGWRG